MQRVNVHFAGVCQLQPSHMHVCLKPTDAAAKHGLCMCAEACFVHVCRTRSAPRSCPRTLCPTKLVVRSQGCPAPPKVDAICRPAATNQQPAQVAKLFARSSPSVLRPLCIAIFVAHAFLGCPNRGVNYPAVRTFNVTAECPKGGKRQR